MFGSHLIGKTNNALCPILSWREQFSIPRSFTSRHICLFVVMPDHIHALLSFERDQSMSEVVGDWKRFHTHKNQVLWQEDYFDHRLRDDERGEQFAAKVNYIRRNPVVAGLCKKAEDWPWVIDNVNAKG